MSPAAFAFLALAFQSAAPPDPALVAEARAAPLAFREAVTDALRAGDLASAGRLASAHAEAWQDSFLVREVARFAAWPSGNRASKLAADSVRRAGNAAFGSEGTRAAIEIWREALRRAMSIGDTALAAAVTGNIGAGFLRDNQLDSAETYAGRAARLARGVGDRRVEANAITLLGGVREERGDLAGARTEYLEALALHERMGDTRGVAAGRNNLGLLARASGDLSGARRQFEAALELNRTAGRADVAATNQVNLAAVAVLEGDFEAARGLYREALVAWSDAPADAADALYGLGQLELRRGDYVAAGRSFLEALETYEATGPLASELAARRGLAGSLAARGDLQGALDALREADDLAIERAAAADARAGITLARADLAVQLNSLAEAERLYSGAERLYREAGDPSGEAQAQHGLGVLLLTSGDLTGAGAMFDRALLVQQASGDSRAAGITRLALGETARERGDTAVARRHLADAISELEGVADPVSAAAALGELGRLDADRGLPASAEARYREAIAKLGDRVAPDVAWRLWAGLALAHRQRGAVEDAARALRTAIDEVERTGGLLALPERRAGFLADKWDVYTQLAMLERGRGRPGSAFEVSERLRAREMLELLGRGRIEAPPNADAAFVTQEQDLRRRIAQLTTELEGTASGSLRGRDVIAGGDVVREALLAAQAAYAELLLETRERTRNHAELVSPRAVGWREVARQLGEGEALIEYLVGDSASLAFLVLPDSLAVVDLGIGRAELARLVAFARGTVESPRPATDSLWRGPFRRLYRHLIAPVEDTGLLEGTRRLVLVPHVELHYLPFSALLSDSEPLVARYDLATTPSATLWLALGERSARRRPAGVLAMAPRPNALPGSEREVRAVGRLAGDGVEVLTGPDATEAAFRRAAPGRRVLHLSTYGVLNQHNPLFSFVEFAPDGGEDGRLEVHEVFGLALDADVVVLSACQTGLASGRLADVPAGDDWVGLTRAFLHAGARSVVATLWAVEDRGTATLMEEFYAADATRVGPDRALAGAQREMLRGPATAHPFYWAGVVVVEGRHR